MVLGAAGLLVTTLGTNGTLEPVDTADDLPPAGLETPVPTGGPVGTLDPVADPTGGLLPVAVGTPAVALRVALPPTLPSLVYTFRLLTVQYASANACGLF